MTMTNLFMTQPVSDDLPFNVRSHARGASNAMVIYHHRRPRHHDDNEDIDDGHAGHDGDAFRQDDVCVGERK